MENPWKTINKRTVYENPWISVTHREVINPSGNEGIYGVVHFKNLAIGIVPLDEHGYTWLVGQYRYTLDRYSWEIPEGGCPVGTSPLESAKRELLEETGITAARWEHILDFHLSNSVSDEAGMAFIARDLSFGEAQPEETEDLLVKKVPFTEALEMIYRGEITDSLSIMGLLRAKVWLEEG
ncbi:NUDIX domain-containing protein [Flavilitoribacter nigricans]|uniref:GDP-mannose pyrophosphatase n=1 Tax=Flavilitoribacter nigricans (strain ATCC 23147 / DSM 23189 / NBRC 102662 / NCIMB 1420 / SS-2) TaxID=1122177 RepID=A0A2D0MZT9_FLAN2|nr:NUDIX hydrolase [Flavilitoribacter nigricans]PHN01409.1 DNA mismatch repair protein MutT [Flavilitoribacter nigricans DSM 23189 = NBRC 102662]